MAEAVRRTVAFHRDPAPVAAEYGVRVALEPLNPVSSNEETAIRTPARALDVVEEAGRDGDGVCRGTWSL